MPRVCGALIGGLAGAALLGSVEGLDFILTSLFVVLAMDAYRAHTDRATLGLAVSASVLAAVAAPDSMVLVAMTLFTTTLLVRHHQSRRPSGAAHA